MNDLNELSFEDLPDNCSAEYFPLFFALGDKMRLNLFLYLLSSKNTNGLRVGQITEVTHLSRPAVSHHLKILKESNLINMRSEGTKNYYYIDEHSDFFKLKTLLSFVYRQMHNVSHNIGSVVNPTFENDAHLMQAIADRSSVRHYHTTPVSSEKLDILKNKMAQINLESNLSIGWVEDGSGAFLSLLKSYGFFSGIRSLFAMKGKRNDPFLYEKLGYYGEYLILEAVNLGLGTCWVGTTFDKSIKFMNVMDDEELVLVVTVGDPDHSRNNFKAKLLNTMLHQRKAPSLETLYSADRELPSWFLRGMRSVQKAPSSFGSHPVKFKFMDGIVSAHVKDPSVMNLVNLGIAKAHFVIACGGAFAFGNGANYLTMSSSGD